MQLLPLVSLSPFIFFKIKKLKQKNINHIIIGFFAGLIPLIIYFLISFNTYGVSSFIEPYQLLYAKSLTESNFLDGFIFYPRNILIFTFPFCIFIFIGSRFILRTKSRDLFCLFFLTPLINILILMLTASKYSHYALFSIPFIASNASFGIFECYQNNSSVSKLTLRIFGLLNAILNIPIIFSVLFGSYLNIKFNSTFLESALILALSLISFYLSISFLHKVKFRFSNINNILSILVIQILLLSFLFSTGKIGNPNNKFKQFVYQQEINKIAANNKIYLIGKLDDKYTHLLKFYLPSHEKFNLDEISYKDPNYGFINDEDIAQLENFDKYKFIVIRKYENINFIKFI